MRDVHGGRHGRLLPRDDLEHVDGDAEHDRVGEAHGDGHPVEVVPPHVGADGELVRGALQYRAANDGSHEPSPVESVYTRQSAEAAATTKLPAAGIGLLSSHSALQPARGDVSPND